MARKMIGRKIFIKFGSILKSIMFLYTMIQQFVPYAIQSKFEKFVHELIGQYVHTLLGYWNPNIQITFHEFVGEHMERSKAYTAIQSYLSKFSNQAKRLKADVGRNSTNVVLSMDDHEEVPDEYEGVKLFRGDEKRYYKLTFYRWNREVVINSYLKHVLEKGNAIAVQNRQRWLYTNNTSYNRLALH
ncbi:hypothetical protein AQUCO_00200727v1 [Aquilegia coerulea]|uniref:AAA-type ATPase N-terminal domain-containing protein n=1 Tax=Aquilegia coerulea TaxID=218851 RepID=A0A2G5F4H3_AQUCA|nr:hypothetical protein AQUCO_00200727v1 [Aquilegia coerulea]